ncbi:MAG: efflux RND transporter periplasmic adaptor subunit [Anaerolineae bacterium]|nr:efflux RND transporter periplasmic adaptor subunit [Anaerolineae bacterium]
MKRPVGCSLLLLAVLLLGIPVLVFAGRQGQAAAQAAQRADIELYTVVPGDVTVAVTALGQVDADTNANLSFSSAGRVAEVMAQQGDLVRAGDVVARLSNDAQQIAVEQARLGLETAQLRRDDLLAGPDSGQIAVAQANIDAARAGYRSAAGGADPDDLRAAELSYQQAQAAVANAQEARTTASGGQPEQAYSLLDAQVGAASFQAEIARLRLQAMRRGSGAQAGPAAARIDQAEAELARLLAGPTQSQIDSADAAIAQASAALDRAQSALDNTLLTAPIDGTITTLDLEVGMLIAPSVPLGVVTDVTPLRVRVNVDEIDVRQLHQDMNASITFDALDNIAVPATVEQIALIGVDQGGIVSYPVTLRLDESADSRIRVGMTAEASLITDTVTSVLYVPNRFIRLDRQHGTAFVNRVNAAGELEEIEITLGLQGEENSEIVDGLQPGDVIAVELGGDAISMFGGG